MNAKQVKQMLENLTDEELLKLSPLGTTRNRSPHPRQADFLGLKCEEALYGGAAGGGKTEALLMWLAEGIGVPGYSAIFFRRTYAQLVKSNDSPVTKSHELFKPLGGKYKASEYRWNFPSGASIEFGHLQHEQSVMDYQGPAYHRVAFDELAGDDHLLHLAERAIQNLGPFQPSPRRLIFWPTPERAFVPARVADNPSLDIDDYIQRMQANLPPVLRERLLNGDWSIVEDAIIRLDWLRYYEELGDMLRAFDGQGRARWNIDGRQCQRFATIDTAGTSAQKAAERVHWEGLKAGVRRTLEEWRPSRVLIENAHHGPH